MPFDTPPLKSTIAAQSNAEFFCPRVIFAVDFENDVKSCISHLESCFSKAGYLFLLVEPRENAKSHRKLVPRTIFRWRIQIFTQITHILRSCFQIQDLCFFCVWAPKSHSDTHKIFPGVIFAVDSENDVKFCISHRESWFWKAGLLFFLVKLSESAHRTSLCRRTRI